MAERISTYDPRSWEEILGALLAETDLHLLSEAALSGRGKQYRARLRSAVRALWTGVFDLDDYFENMLLVIEQGLTDAWHEGAKACGIGKDDLDKNEKNALAAAIRNEKNFVFRFGDTIDTGSKANKGKLGPLMKRADLWANRYPDIVNRAQLMACENQKMRWDLGIAEHCKSCLKLSGQVRRAKVWKQKGIQPQAPPNAKLECKGWKCACKFTVTDEPITRGRFPRLP